MLDKRTNEELEKELKESIAFSNEISHDYWKLKDDYRKLEHDIRYIILYSLIIGFSLGAIIL